MLKAEPGDLLTRSELMAYALSVVVAGTSTALVMTTDLGVDRWVVFASAVFVMSGTATLALLGVLDAGGSVVTAMAAAMLVAARFGLLAIPLSQRFKGRPVWERTLASYPILDPAVAMAFREESHEAGRRSYIRMGRVSATTWIGGMALGVLLGSLIPDPKTWGMDVAFPALLLATAGGIARKSRDMALTGLVGAAIALATTPFTPAGLPVLLAVGAAAIGLRKKSEEPSPDAAGDDTQAQDSAPDDPAGRDTPDSDMTGGDQ